VKRLKGDATTDIAAITRNKVEISGPARRGRSKKRGKVERCRQGGAERDVMRVGGCETDRNDDDDLRV
jgi:hypothetical protein